MKDIKEKLTFRERVLRVVAKIPEGRTLTYGEVAELAGSPGAFRAVGNIMSKNWDPKIPCHRVIRANGSAGGYNRGARNKELLLAMEKKRAEEKLLLKRKR